jgi:hypothetical protein
VTNPVALPSIDTLAVIGKLVTVNVPSAALASVIENSNRVNTTKTEYFFMWSRLLVMDAARWPGRGDTSAKERTFLGKILTKQIARHRPHLRPLQASPLVPLD